MTVHTFHKPGISATTIERKDERLALITVSIRGARKWNAHEEALHMVYTEALLAGAGNYDRKSFIDTLSTHGISLTTNHAGGVLTFTLSAIDVTMPIGLRLFMLVCSAPNFTAGELKRIKTFIKNGLILAKEDARMRAYTQFSNTLTNPESPEYSHDLLQLEKEVQKVTATELQKLHKHYMSSHWVATLGGSHTIIEKIQTALSTLRKKFDTTECNAICNYDSIDLHQKAVLLLDIPSKHNIEFSIGAPLPLTRSDTAFPACVFGLSVLGLYGGFTGRLMSIVREKEGLTYSIYAQAERSTLTQTGFWRIMTFFNPKDAVQGIRSTVREIDKIHRDGISTDEHTRFHAILHTRFAMIEDSIQKKVREVHGYTLAGHTLHTYTSYKEKLLSVTQDEVNDALHTHIKTDQILISGAGPIEQVSKELMQFGSI